MSLLKEVMAKKEYQGLDENFVSSVMQKYYQNYDFSKKSGKTKFLKEVRAKLREVYGVFRARNYDRRWRFFEELKGWDDKEGCEKILRLHLSSRERLEHYDKLYRWIREYVDFKSVLDLGCGFNVFSMPWMGKVAYYGVDVNKDDVEFCNKYMGEYGFQWGVRWGNLFTFDNFVPTDVCFMFKILDGLESIERGASAKLLNKVRSSFIVVSFPMRSISGKSKITARRKWFEDLVVVLAKKKFGDEVYYICKR